MLNLNTLRQQQIPVMTECRAQIPFHILAKPIGSACNLACRYCYTDFVAAITLFSRRFWLRYAPGLGI